MVYGRVYKEKLSWQNVLAVALVAFVRLLNLAEGFLVHFAVTNLWLKLNCRPFMSSPLLSGFVADKPQNISFDCFCPRHVATM